MIKIEVTGDTRQITSKTGAAYTFQVGYAHTVGPDGKAHAHPERFEFFAPKSGPVKAGLYILAPAAVYVDRNGRLSVAPDRLVPAPVAGAK